MKLRERIAEAAYRKSRGADDWLSGEEPYPGYKESYRDHYRGIADEAIAAFAEALLQPEVVEAAARKLLHYQQNSMPGPEVSEDYAWDMQFDNGREEARQEARAAITAALAAITAPAGDGTG